MAKRREAAREEQVALVAPEADRPCDRRARRVASAIFMRTCLWLPAPSNGSMMTMDTDLLSPIKAVFVYISAVERAGLRGLREGRKVSFEIETERKSGKQSAGQLTAA